MEIEYKLQEEDYISFNLHHAKKSPSLKRNLLIQRLMGPFIFTGALILATYYTDIPFWYWFLIFAPLSLAWLHFYPRYLYWEMNKRLKKMLNEGTNKGLFQSRKITIDQEGISQDTETGHSEASWNNVDSIDETEEYIFIYDSSVSAFIIPKRIFKNNAEQHSYSEKIARYFPKFSR